MKREISASIIADSINPDGNRVTSFVLVFPRFILAELNTHRAFSRNSASSRAIPFKKMVKMVEEDPFTPIKWMKDHSGMQGTEYIEDVFDVNFNNQLWLEARRQAVSYASKLSDRNTSKQVVNRLLEPFMWHTAIVTATDFENFFAQRANESTEIHFQDLAYKMLDAMNESTPRSLDYGEWHIPFGDNIDREKVVKYFNSIGKSDIWEQDFLEAILKIATARCARVSYMNFEGSEDYGKDIELYDKLVEMGHMSPLEHVCCSSDGDISFGNFRGWRQLRHSVKGENKEDSRLIKKYYKK